MRSHQRNRETESDVHRESLKGLLDQGLSVAIIAKRFGKHPSTVSYWMAKHGLEAVSREKHMAKGGIDGKRLEELVEAGASIAKIAEVLQRSPGSVRHWLSAYGLETRSTAQRRIAKRAREAGRSTVQRRCQHHGVTDFWLEGRGAYRCLLCRQEAVVRRRRKIKQILVAEAGGACAICGYDRHIGGLHFHHRDPAVKSFALSVDGVARSLERARAEARKCILLCSNCHAEVEAGIAAIPA
jgi:transposase